jgi:glyoxylase-like metal-dependent hydrolase (beta-lactamase superfamily II)
MKIRVLGAYGAEGLGQRPTSFLVNDRILIDAGTVGGALTMPEQTLIEHALITHSHLDHVAGLAFLTETLAFSERG